MSRGPRGDENMLKAYSKQWLSREAEGDYKRSQRIESYRIGEQFLFLPVGISWKYIPLKEIQRTEAGQWKYSGKGCCVRVNMELPSLEVFCGELQISLRFNVESSVKQMRKAIEKT